MRFLIILCILACSCSDRRHLGNCKDICADLAAGAVVEKLTCSCGAVPTSRVRTDAAAGDAGPLDSMRAR
jgi:hypothetical protein